jgi:hypothetical protein
VAALRIKKDSNEQQQGIRLNKKSRFALESTATIVLNYRASAITIAVKKDFHAALAFKSRKPLVNLL